jgi:hypothetical protein
MVKKERNGMQNDSIKDLKPVNDENRRIPNFSQISGPLSGSL